MYNLNSNIGKRIAEFRKLRKMTQETLADTIGKARSTLNKYELGTIIPDIQTILAICNALDIKIQQLVELETNTGISIVNPFESENIYLYYISYNNLIESRIEFKEEVNQIKATMYNAITVDEKTYAYKYEGKLEVSNKLAYINLVGRDEGRYEKVQIIIDLRLTADGTYGGSIMGTANNNNACVKKCMFTTKKLSNADEYNKCFKRVEITESEIEGIKKNKFWIIENSKSDMYLLKID